MSSNVGLSTPRGSGTSGYVQRNLSHLKPRDNAAPYLKSSEGAQCRQRQPNAKILAHDRARDIEVQVFELRDKLEDEGVDEEEVESQTEALRQHLIGEKKTRRGPARGLKSHQVHELAAAKIEESENLRKALKIAKDYEEASYWERREKPKEGK